MQYQKQNIDITKTVCYRYNDCTLIDLHVKNFLLESPKNFDNEVYGFGTKGGLCCRKLTFNFPLISDSESKSAEVEGKALMSMSALMGFILSPVDNHNGSKG